MTEKEIHRREVNLERFQARLLKQSEELLAQASSHAVAESRKRVKHSLRGFQGELESLRQLG